MSKHTVAIRAGRAEDAGRLAKICYDAFCGVNARHGFPPDFPNVEMAEGLMHWALGYPGVESFVAEVDGKAVGSAFLWDGAIGGVGPVTVAPDVQAKSVGRTMMQAVVARSRERKQAGLRLVQAGFNMTSLSLYTKLGFDVREPLVCINGPALKTRFEGYHVRPATEADIEQCDQVCRFVHGHERTDELRFGLSNGTARVVEHQGTIVGYACDVGFFAHAVTTGNTSLKALIAAAEQFSGPGFLLPSRNSELLRWCLASGLRATQPANMMSIGLYNEPRGSWLASIKF